MNIRVGIVLISATKCALRLIFRGYIYMCNNLPNIGPNLSCSAIKFLFHVIWTWHIGYISVRDLTPRFLIQVITSYRLYRSMINIFYYLWILLSLSDAENISIPYHCNVDISQFVTSHKWLMDRWMDRYTIRSYENFWAILEDIKN